MEVAERLKKQLGEKLEEHKPLNDFTTMHVGGVADFFYSADTIEELVAAVQAAVDTEIPYFVLGGGSNVIISDYGYPGLVILNRTSNIAFLYDKSQAIVDSGVFLAHLVMKAAAQDLGGLEFLVGVPGTVGGAVYNNVSCWGGVIGDYVKGITVLFPGEKDEKCQVKSLEGEVMEFGYHTTGLKEAAKRLEGRKPVILSIRLQMTHLRREEIMRRIQQYRQMRQDRQPIGVLTAGSIFKNPSGAASNPQVDNPDISQTSAGYLIDSAGGKRLKVGGASISKKHANFIVNNGKAKAVEIRALIEQLRDTVREKHGVLLEEEVEYLGEWPDRSEG